MPELPDQLDVSVTLGGQPLGGAWVELRLPMARKRDYVLMVGPADPAGRMELSHAELENQIQFIQLSAFGEYGSLGVWRGELVLTPFDVGATRHADERFRAWDANLRRVYPLDFPQQMKSLRQRLSETSGLALELSATAHGGSAHLSCVSGST